MGYSEINRGAIMHGAVALVIDRNSKFNIEEKPSAMPRAITIGTLHMLNN